MFSPDKQVLVNFHLQQFRQLSIKWYYDGMLMFTSENESKFDIPSISFMLTFRQALVDFLLQQFRQEAIK